MIIRRDQMRTFEEYMRRSFEDRMVAHMAENYPAAYGRYVREGDGDSGARALVRQAVERAGLIGAKKEGSIQRYLEIMLETSPDFEKDESMDWARKILADTTLSGETRITLAHRKLSRLRPGAPRSGSGKE